MNNRANSQMGPRKVATPVPWIYAWHLDKLRGRVEDARRAAKSGQCKPPVTEQQIYKKDT